MDNYLVLFHGSTVRPGMSPEEMQALVARYRAWGDKLRTEGRYVGSNRLEASGGKVLRKESALRITDGPYAETKDVVAGYFLLQAASYEEAVELCKDCPHLDGGTIEVRRIQAM